MTHQLTQSELLLIYDALTSKEVNNIITLEKIQSGEIKEDADFKEFTKNTIENTKKLKSKILESYRNY